ncbi:MAG: nitrite reductase [Candidatus Omnitrophica bacterium]|nr:nitrite reductase [Candidatus Omnitrophota bacterium]
MPNTSETIKQRYGNPFDVLKAIERAATAGVETLTEDDLFMCKWLGLYTHRHEPEYFMLRTKQPNGFVTPEQLAEIAAIAEQWQKGYADITTRQDFQLHWVHYSKILPTLERLKRVGIGSLGACGDILRNVVGCPVAGVDREELFDASPIAKAVSDFFYGNVKYANLPRKYKIGVSGCRTWCSLPEIQCVSLVAASRAVDGRQELGFDLRVGGGLSTQPFISQRMKAFIRPEDAVPVIQQITDLWSETPEYREKRHHARFKYLIHDWGVAKFRETVEARLGRKLDDAPADYEEPSDSYRDHVGVHAQKQDGLYYVGSPVLVGRITSPQMKRVADLCRRYGDGNTIRLTVRQNILLLNIPERNVESVLSGLADVGLSINAHPIRRSVVTCTGTEFCKLAITETKARSRQIVEYLEQHVPLAEPLRLHITGCPNSCAQYQIANIGLMGSKTKVDGQIVDAYDVFVGGRLGKGAGFNHPIVRKIPAAECAKRLERVLVAFTQQRKARESFHDWCARVGDAELAKLLTGGQPHPLSNMDDVPTPQVPESDGPVY